MSAGPQQDAIVEIPERRVKFFGRRGRMLLPSPQTVAEAVERIPPGRVVTTGSLRAALAEQFAVEATCPVTLKKSLLAAAAEARPGCWRVVGQDGALLAGYPGGRQAQAERLLAEGVKLEARGKKPVVAGLFSLAFDLRPRAQDTEA